MKNDTDRTLRALATLLAYPGPELRAALGEIRALLQADPRIRRGRLGLLLEELGRDELHALQERYVALFDRARALSLHLFEHVHGESRDRGQAMIDLLETYARRGYAMQGNELPDYLPAFLEFASLVGREEARGLLGEASGILRTLGDRLAERGSLYAELFAALLELAGEPGLTKRIAPVRRAGEEGSPTAIDRAWMEEPVTFMGGPQPGAQPVRFYRKGALA
jgi:nitrate reductase delta subunit